MIVEDAVVSLWPEVKSISGLQSRMVGWANVVAEICLPVGVAAIRNCGDKSRHLIRRVARHFISLFVCTIVHSAMIPRLHLPIYNTHDSWSEVAAVRLVA